MSYQPYLDQLIAYGSEEPRKADLLEAKGEYFRLTGEVFEDDKIFELRMASFLDYYLYDRVSPLTGKTPAAELYEQRGIFPRGLAHPITFAFTRDLPVVSSVSRPR